MAINWRNPTIVAALIAVGGGAVGGIFSLLKSDTPPGVVFNLPDGLYPQANDQSQEYLGLLESRAQLVREAIERNGHPDAKALSRFNQLHRRNLDAVRNGQDILSHELTNEINTIVRDINIVEIRYNKEKAEEPGR